MTEVKCPYCGKKYEISEEQLGKKAKCLGCEKVFTLEKEENLEKIEKVEKYEKGQDLEIKPHKWSFIFFNSLLSIWISFLIISIIIGIFVKEAFFISVFFLIISVISFFWTEIRYRKEKYKLTDKKIIYDYGNLISDNSVEINLDKITQVNSILGFFQYHIFKTGDLLIKTAGASTSKIKLNNVLDTMNLYEETQIRMRKNGFHLKKDKIVQEAKPHWIGVVGEIIEKPIYLFYVIFFIISIPYSGIVTGIFNNLYNLENLRLFLIYMIPINIVFFTAVLTIVFSYLDLKRRKYDIYSDSVFYTEGFLTKNYAFLPMEKVANTENTQSFWSKVFGLHDVIISSEGSSNNVVFKNMINGERMMKNIKYLKDNITMSEKEVLSGKQKEKEESIIGFVDKTEKVLDYNKDFKAIYKMDAIKTFFVSIIVVIIGILLCPLIGLEIGLSIITIAIFIAFSQIIPFFATEFIVDNSTIEKKFDFLNHKHNSFSVEKITGVIIKESILDMLLKTCSITFWSIGSSSNITFKNIKKTEDLEKNILSKIGVYRKKKSEKIPINFNLLNFLKANIIASTILGIIIVIILIIYIYNKYVLLTIIPISLLTLLYYLWGRFYYSKRFYSQKVYEDFVESISGIIFRKKYFVLNRNIKGLKAKKYPLTKAGSFTINISGEQMIQNKKSKTISILSNSVSFSYVEDIFMLQNILDDILTEDKLDTNIVKSSKQDVGNSIIFVGIFTILIFIGLFAFKIGAGNEIDEKGFWIIVILTGIIFFIIIGFIIWSIKVKFYNLEKNRALYGSGIIYKTRKTILYKKFNFVSKNQGFLGKIFGNGVVNIYTLGSGSVDMTLSDTSDFKEIYELLKKD